MNRTIDHDGALSGHNADFSLSPALIRPSVGQPRSLDDEVIHIPVPHECDPIWWLDGCAIEEPLDLKEKLKHVQIMLRNGKQ